MTASDLSDTLLAYKAKMEISWVPRYVKNPRTGNVYLMEDISSFRECVCNLGYVPVEVIEEARVSV